MLRSLLRASWLRLAFVGMPLLGLQRTLFTDLRPFGVAVQILLALAVAAGAAGGPQKGALAGFVLGLLYDLGVGTPLGSSSISMGTGGFVAGYVRSVAHDPQWWLLALFVGAGAAVGEALVPLVRSFIGEEQVFSPRLITVVLVVAVAAIVVAPLFIPVGRWCLGIKRGAWKGNAALERVDVAE